MKQRLKIDYKKSILTLLILGVFAYFSYFGPLERKDLLSNISTIENEFFTPKLISDYVRKHTKEAGLISEGNSYVLGEYGMIRPFSKNRINEAGMISFDSDMGTSLNNDSWAKEITERLDEKYKEDAEVIVKMQGDLCVAEIYQHGRLQSLYFENMLHNSVQGFSGPIYMGIEMTLQGKLQEVSYITSKETESYLRKVLRSSYLDQYKNLNTREDTHKIDAMSGATITTRAMAEGITEAFQKTAPLILASYYDYDITAFKVEALLTYWWIVHILVIVSIFLFALLPQIKKTKRMRLAVSIFTMIYVGFGMNASFTYITFLMPFMGTEVSLFLGLYALITLLTAVWGKNVYCTYVCPFGAAQMISLKYSPFKSKKLFITNKQAEYIRYAITIFLFIGFVFGYKRFGNYELFPDLFSTEFSSYWFYIACAFVVISIKYPMLWCRVACPTGCVLDSLKTISKNKKNKMKHSIIFSVACLLLTSNMWTQTKGNTIQVVDQIEGYALMGAHICLVATSGEKRYFAANENGKVDFVLKENLECTVSYTGYITQHLYLERGAFLKVEMKPDLLLLDQVVVTASLAPQKVDQSIYKVNVITSETLEKNGVQNVRDALRFQPNINLQEDGVLGTQVIMQGLEGQHVKFLIDGMPIIGRQDGNIDLSQIDMSQVDHIEIIEGPMSVVYGSNALAGTINIITKKNKYYTWSGNAVAYAESVGQYTGSVNLQANMGKSKFGISGGYRYFEGYDLDETTRSMSWNPKNQINTDAFYGINLQGWETKLGLRASREDLVYKGNYLQPSRAIDTEFLTDRITYYGQFNKKFDNKGILSGLVSYNTYARTSQEYVVKEDLNSKDKKGEETRNSFKTLNARLSYGKEVNTWVNWQAGYELTNESGSGERLNENDGLIENAVWSDVKIRLSDYLTFQPGIRYLHHNVYKAPLIYSAHLKWNSDKKWIARLSFAKGFRTPSLKELYMDFVDSNHKIYGNENLTPESSYNVSATINKTINLSDNSLFKFDASGFYNHLYDVIELTTDADGTSYYYQNISQKKTQGGSFTTSYRHNFFKLNVGLVVTGIGYDLKNNSDFNFKYSTDYIVATSYLWQKIDVSLQLDYKHSGSRVQLLGNGENDEIIEASVDSYDILNFSTTKRIANNKFSITAGVKNILDIKDIASSTQGGAHSGGGSNLISWGSTFFISLKYNLNKI